MVRVTVGGDELRGLVIDEPAASVRLLLPVSDDLVMPTWNGNEFRFADGSRPPIRTFTPRRLEGTELDLDIVLHSEGATSAWVIRAVPGDPVAISGPGRGYDIDPETSRFLLLGDESAIPAISQLLEAIPAAASIECHIEVDAEFGRVPLPDHPRADISWHTVGESRGELLAGLLDSIEPATTHVWAAGQAAAMQRLRKRLFNELGVPRSRATIRGYWK